jgi:hypothetical protein
VVQMPEPTGTSTELGGLGLRQWSKAVSSASVERVYSDLT